MVSYEPKTNGKVCVKTSFGEFIVELWPNAAPKACRNFVQLCLEGYYDGCIFHRVLRDKIIQGGDPTGTGYGGESIYGKPFQDEFHSKLKFNRRGLVAMANEGLPNTNKSQFFVTLSDCAALNKKHTIFGKVGGRTFFSLLDMARSTETDENDRPLYPPKIISAVVTENPFDDIILRKTKQKTPQDKSIKTNITFSKAKPNLLSFQNSGDQSDEETPPLKVKRFTSSHEAARGRKEPKREMKERDSKTLIQKKKNESKIKNADVLPKTQNRKEDNAKKVAKEYKILKNELIRKKKELEMKNMGILESGKEKLFQSKEMSILQKRLIKYKKPKISDFAKREEITMRKLHKFSKAMHRMASSYSKSAPASNSSDESEEENFWYRDGKLTFSKIPPKLQHFTVDDYEVIHTN